MIQYRAQVDASESLGHFFYILLLFPGRSYGKQEHQNVWPRFALRALPFVGSVQKDDDKVTPFPDHACME